MNRTLMILFLVFLFTISGCNTSTGIEKDIDDSTKLALKFLESSHKPYYFEDEYLKYVYPSENLACDIPGCTVTYRHLDAYFDLVWIDEAVDNSFVIRKQVEEAYKVLESLSKTWKDGPINNVIKSTTSEGYALDTFCILGLVMKDKQMAETVKSYMDGSNWMSDDYYEADIWRNIADESWCIELMLVTKQDQALTKPLVDKMLAQTDQFLLEEHSPIEDLAVLIHMLYVLSDVKEYTDMNYDRVRVKYNDLAGWYEYQDTVLNNNLMISNLLDAFVRSEYDNLALMDKIAQTLIDSQKPDGRWTMTNGPDNLLPVFTTMRVVIGLNNYKKYRQANKDKIFPDA